MIAGVSKFTFLKTESPICKNKLKKQKPNSNSEAGDTECK